jgi:hypothetical protein
VLVIDWKPLNSDWLASDFSYQFGVFRTYALQPSIRNEAMFMNPDAAGGHTSNMRLFLALAELNKHMALAVQSAWERDFRRFVRSCATEVRGEDRQRDDRLRTATVEGLGKALEEARGVRFAELPGGETLTKMVLVGNVVRHGDGPSCARLREVAPDLWLGNVHEGMEGVDLRDVADDLSIRTSVVEGFAETVADFWMRIIHTRSPPEPPPSSS